MKLIFEESDFPHPSILEAVEDPLYSWALEIRRRTDVTDGRPYARLMHRGGAGTLIPADQIEVVFPSEPAEKQRDAHGRFVKTAA